MRTRRRKKGRNGGDEFETERGEPSLSTVNGHVYMDTSL